MQHYFYRRNTISSIHVFHRLFDLVGVRFFMMIGVPFMPDTNILFY